MGADRKRGYDVQHWARRAVDEHQLARGPAHVLLLLASHADGEGRLFANVETLAREAGTSTRTIERDLKVLHAKGLVVTPERFGADRRRAADRWLAVPWSPCVEPVQGPPDDLPPLAGHAPLYDPLRTADDPPPTSGPCVTHGGSYPSSVAVPITAHRTATEHRSYEGNGEVESSNEETAETDWELASDEEEEIFARSRRWLEEEAA